MFAGVKSSWLLALSSPSFYMVRPCGKFPLWVSVHSGVSLTPSRRCPNVRAQKRNHVQKLKFARHPLQSDITDLLSLSVRCEHLMRYATSIGWKSCMDSRMAFIVDRGLT